MCCTVVLFKHLTGSSLCCPVLQIIFESRKWNLPHFNDWLLSVDGTDFCIMNPGSKVSSHKFNKKSGLRYEVAVDILRGFIVWIHGPFPAGAWPDISIFRHALKDHLDTHERVEADDGYRGESPGKVTCPASFYKPSWERGDAAACPKSTGNREQALQAMGNLCDAVPPWRLWPCSCIPCNCGSHTIVLGKLRATISCKV